VTSDEAVLAHRQYAELEQADERATFLESCGALRRTFDQPTGDAALAAFEKQLDEQIRLGRVARQTRQDWLRLFRRDPAGARELLAKQGPRLLESSGRGVARVVRVYADGEIGTSERPRHREFFAAEQAEQRALEGELAQLIGVPVEALL
jgi:hypothetical protein